MIFDPVQSTGQLVQSTGLLVQLTGLLVQLTGMALNRWNKVKNTICPPNITFWTQITQN